VDWAREMSSEDHSLEILLSMALEKEETLEEADSSGTTDQQAPNGHQLKI
jgi:hypothetical protein